MQDRVPPQSVEAEQAVLGAALLDGAAFHLALERLTPEDFYRSAHQKIFRAMAEVSSHGDPVDLVTVTARLQDAGQLDECGGASYLAELAHIVPATGNVEHYIDLVHDKSVLRQLIRTATQIAAKGYEPAEDVAGLLDEAEQRIFETQRSGGPSRETPMGRR